jgi:hypothetical protein
VYHVALDDAVVGSFEEQADLLVGPGDDVTDRVARAVGERYPVLELLDRAVRDLDAVKAARITDPVPRSRGTAVDGMTIEVEADVVRPDDDPVAWAID